MCSRILLIARMLRLGRFSTTEDAVDLVMADALLDDTTELPSPLSDSWSPARPRWCREVRYFLVLLAVSVSLAMAWSTTIGSDRVPLGTRDLELQSAFSTNGGGGAFMVVSERFEFSAC